ncbi:MAG: DNA-directed RNA polymerase subunit alpha [Chloroflexota bacterium]|nr:DNA-directed RNA polymerase subunit alpha [Rhodospirillaceae bacterium]MDE2766887.1 DNA-directed RNA polymerase subunit alpha [Chloroflexota bacterium]
MFLGPVESAQAEADIQPTVQMVEAGDDFAHFHIEPLRRGFAHTLGNPLRRVLLAALPGAAIATARVDSALHEFSTLDFMREDLVEFLLNVKGVRLRSHDADSAILYLEAEGPTEVTAGDLELPSGVEIVNAEHHLASLTDAGFLRAEFSVETGAGYVGSEMRGDLPIGVIPLDMVFSPVTKVEYHVEPARVGRESEFDRLVLKIWTDGVMSPADALRGAAQELIESFQLITGVDETMDEVPSAFIPPMPEAEGDPLEDLKLSNRALNSLKRHELETVQELIGMSENDLYELRGMGERLVNEIREALALRGLALADNSSAPDEGQE